MEDKKRDVEFWKKRLEELLACDDPEAHKKIQLVKKILVRKMEKQAEAKKAYVIPEGE